MLIILINIFILILIKKKDKYMIGKKIKKKVNKNGFFVKYFKFQN